MIVDAWHRYRETLDSLLEGFQIIGRDWTYLYVNPAAARHGQRTPDELHGRAMWEVYPGVESTPLFAVLDRCMREGVPTSFENLFTFPDGTSRWFEIRVQPVPEGICVHSVDIQARKDAEARLREQESAATLGHMAAVVAHEIKNPLAGVSGALQVLKRRRAADDAEVPVFDEMLACLDSLDRLVRDLLVFAKPIEIRAAPVPIADVVHDALAFFADDEALKRHTVTTFVEEPAPVVAADRELLGNVFRNLLQNAAQAMPAPGTIEVRMMRLGSLCRVTVSDTGPGVPSRIADRLFEPFVTGRKGGTGLGLSISRRIVRLHGGDVELVPADGPGATFVVSIPLQP